jgi:hypothetical protein
MLTKSEGHCLCSNTCIGEKHVNKILKCFTISASLYTYVHTYIHPYMRTFKRTYTHTYKNTYMHAYIHADVLAYVTDQVCARVCVYVCVRASVCRLFARPHRKNTSNAIYLADRRNRKSWYVLYVGIPVSYLSDMKPATVTSVL